jgi:hypothetical protein
LLLRYLCLPYYVYVFSTKLEIRAEQVLLGGGEEGRRWGKESKREKLPKQCTHM